MKHYGLKTIIGICVYILAIFSAFLYFSSFNDINLGLGFPLVFGLYMLINAPLINIYDNCIAVNTLNPFYKNVKACNDEVEKVIIDINDFKFRLTLQMKDGTFRHTRATRYRDMKPVFNALRRAGMQVESNGIGTIDWA